MDHQVEHDVDVGAAFTERRQALALDEARPDHAPTQRADGGIEALEMADLQDAAPANRELEQLLPLVDRSW